MTKEEAKKAAEVMLAYADGKTIECFVNNSIGWVEGSESPKFNWDDFDYRVKGTPSYRPFKDAEECWSEMQKHQPLGWIKPKDAERFYCITILSANLNVCNSLYRYTEGFNNFTFADGQPFGIKED